MIKKVALLFFILVSAQCFAKSYVMVDFPGNLLGLLPAMETGDEQVVPLNMIVKKAGWNTESSSEETLIDLKEYSVLIHEKNPFIRVNNSYIQLSTAPQQWDGSFWIPLSSLGTIFPSSELVMNYGSDTLMINKILSDNQDDLSLSDSSKYSWKLGTVIIDPGHGGKDPGAVGLYGLQEKIVTMDISRKLSKILRDQGINSVLTRENDKFVPLNERTTFANAKRGDLFISVHVNSSLDPNPKGVCSYILKPARTTQAIEAASRENSVVKLEDNDSLYHELTDQNYILMTMATSQYIKDSEAWSELAVNKTSFKTGLTLRGVDQAGFYVLIGASMPAILFECGFLSNPDDAEYLSTDKGKQKIAEALGESIVQVKNLLETSASR